MCNKIKIKIVVGYLIFKKLQQSFSGLKILSPTKSYNIGIIFPIMDKF